MLVLFIFFVSAAFTPAAVFTIDHPGVGADAQPGDGIAADENGMTSLTAAIQEANALPGADTIQFGYWVTSELGSLVYIAESLTVSDDLFILNYPRFGANIRPLFEFQGPALVVKSDVRVILESVSFAMYEESAADYGSVLYAEPGAFVEFNSGGIGGGRASFDGGSVYLDHATLVLRKSTGISGSSGRNGGAVYSLGGVVYMEDSGVNGTADGDGGGIYNDGGVVVSVNSGVSGVGDFADGNGGAIFSRGGELNLASYVSEDNSAKLGGVFYLTQGAVAHLSGSSIRENASTGSGGAFYVDAGSTLNVSNSVIARSSSGAGGGAASVAGEATFINCTFAENTSTGTGGSLEVLPGGVLRLGNSVVAAASSVTPASGIDIAGEILSLGHNFIRVGAGGSGYAPSDTVGVVEAPLDPMIVYNNNYVGDGPEGIFVPTAGSPLIDAGDPTLLTDPRFAGSPCTDIRVLPRARGASVDIGAVEVQEGETTPTCALNGPPHASDLDADGRIGIGELLRGIQLYNTGEFHCDPTTEDTYAPGPGPQTCPPHTADNHPQDWTITLTELLRLIQFYNSPGYTPCDTGEDGFCPNPT